MKNITPKKPPKDQREKLVLLGLVELYLKTGSPIGSNTLRENGFENISSATIRNYFVRLEEEGYLKQQHSSGGRTPTSLALKLYAQSHLESSASQDKENELLYAKLVRQSRGIAAYLQEAAEIISEKTGCAVFLSAPRFDQDFVLDIKLLSIDQNRCLCVLVTDFGMVHTEILHTEKKLSNFSLKRLEAYFHWRITGIDKPELSSDEEKIATRFYREIMLRHIVSYNNFTAEDIYKTGFSKLLSYPDFNNTLSLASGLSLFENPNTMRTMLGECCKANSLLCWIGDDLHEHAPQVSSCSVIAIPYRINQTVVGALAILGPLRISYPRLFSILKTASDAITETLTRSMYKFKITFRQPEAPHLDYKKSAGPRDTPHGLLVENQTEEFGAFHE
ncbi:MAG: heat-inducible transcriptional repressor HrcA [Chlamydiales bacterium]|nr:heat-inducible transcriptional repressor HrcA [Chlamydiales bacterium]